VLEPGSAGYSDVAVSPVVRSGISTNSAALSRVRDWCSARFNLDWLTDGKDSWEKKR